MAQEIQVLRWCDIHLNVKDERVEARAWALLVSDDQSRQRAPRSVDLCDDCVADLGLIALREVIVEHGVDGQGKHLRGAAAPAAKAADDVCDVCGRTFVNLQGLRNHQTRVHREGSS